MMLLKPRLVWLVLAGSLIWSETGQTQERPIVIRAATLIDGKGGVMRNASIVVQGARITQIDAGAQAAT